MEFFYKDYEYPSFGIRSNGYFIPHDFINVFISDKSIIKSNEVTDEYILPKDNVTYFGEANIITKINLNEDNYFDFSKAIIDVGAWVGVYSFRTFFNFTYAFEPNKIIYQFLNINLILHDENRFLRSKTYNVALSDKAEEIDFDGFSNSYTFSSHELMNENTMEKIMTHTLDEYNCENVGLIKVDVEGMDEKVLRGGLGTIIRNNYPPILFELWPLSMISDNYNIYEEKRNSIISFLKNLGYDILWEWGDFETHLAIHPKFYNI